MKVVEKDKNLPVKELREEVFTEENLNNGISVVFVGTDERFAIIFPISFTKKKVDKLIGNIRRARQLSGLPRAEFLF